MPRPIRILLLLCEGLVRYAQVGWWGLIEPRLGRGNSLCVLQAVVLSPAGVLLSVRSDLHGWELPGGAPQPGEGPEQALRREVREETGLEVDVERHVGDYVKTGFRPHTARVFICRPVGGALRESDETRAVRWFDPQRVPDTLFPWYRQPLADALGEATRPVTRRAHQGLSSVLAALRIDLRMRLSDDRAGLP